MDFLIFNAVLRIESSDLKGFYRVLAAPPGEGLVWLAYIGELRDSVDTLATPQIKCARLIRVALETLRAINEDDGLRPVELLQGTRLLANPDGLNDTERRLWEARRVQAAPLMDSAAICRTLVVHSSIAPLIRMSAASRATGNRLWHILCLRGFEPSSLYPRFDRCGAPGVCRFVEGGRRKNGRKSPLERLGLTEVQPQRGVTADDHAKILHHARALMKPGLSQRRLYDLIVERVYVTRYEEAPSGRLPVAPPQGTFPNERQVRPIVTSGIARLEKLRLKTTEGHYQRNLRGLRGRAFDGVPGPGHAYAIDSTIGDIHLRSSINRAWPVGRPIVYVVVDVWSTAVVGFYICLTGPSWDTAKLALFSSCSNPRLLASLWGYEYVDVLTPAPTLPYHLWTDRGEYVSAAARLTCELIRVSLAVNPAYRPDLKGLVEVLHRIAKDWQSPFVPGAIDARRPELELRPSAKQSALTLREYAQYLYSVFVQYNLCADRRHRMTAEMIACDVVPSPAGLWRFGHEAGFGYRQSLSQDRLMASLLREGEATVRRDGVFLESLQYEADIIGALNWTAQARNLGHFTQPAFHFPGSVSKFWWPDPKGSMQEFCLRGNALSPSESTLEEWQDALAYERTKRAARDHARVQIALQQHGMQQALVNQAVALTAEADAAYIGKKLTSREGRALENMPKEQPAPQTLAPEVHCDTERNAVYDALMDQALSDIGREGEAG